MRIVPLNETTEPILAPDLIWTGERADLAVDRSMGDLQTGAALATAVLICLQTDRRVDASELPDGETNRGWPGDAFDLQPDDRPLGSKLWLLRRRALTDDVALLAEDYAREALQTLIDQGAVVRIDVSVTSQPAQNRLTLNVALFGRDGNQTYHDKFAVFWDQLNGL